MNGSIIIYRLPSKTDHKILNKFCQEFYGQNSSSHGGKYQYHREGFLEDIPYRKLIRGVIIIKNQDIDKIISFLEDYSAEIHIRNIELTGEDMKELM